MRWRARVARIAAVCVLCLPTGVDAAQRGGPEWTPALLDQWVVAVETHSAGRVDPPLTGAARWSSDDLRRLWVEAQILLEIVGDPRRTRFEVEPLVYDRRTLNHVRTFRPAERAAIDALAARVRLVGTTVFVTRAAMVHTDLVTLAADAVRASAGATTMGAPMLMLVGDGGSAGAESVSLHWMLARMLLVRGVPLPGLDLFVRDWFRATLAMAQATEIFDSVHLRVALRVLPDDPVVLLLAGCAHEALATPLFQAFAAAARTRVMRPDVESAERELRRAEGYFRRALEGDPGLSEARVRLGQVLGAQGRHADSRRELELAVQAPLEPAMAYFAALLTGAAHRALGDAAAAEAAFRRASVLAPDARTPQLALAGVLRDLGDREGSAASLARALTPPSMHDAIDPWWRYRGIRGHGSATWLDALRATARRLAP